MAAWPVLSGLSVGVGSVTGSVTGPAVAQLIDCQSGPVGSIGKCALTSAGTVDSAEATFQDGARAAGEQVVLTLGYPVRGLTSAPVVASVYPDCPKTEAACASR